MVVTIDKCLNITPGLTAPLVVHCSQGDTGLQLSFGIMVGREPFDPTGCIVSAHGVRQDGAGWGPVECTVVDKRVVLDLPAAATAVRGTGMAEIMISKAGTTVGTANFGIMVEVATFPEGVTADDDMSVYQSILEYTQKLGSPLVAETAADMTDTSRTYVYTGTETGYTNGNWYYYDGSAWVSGGIYGSVAPEGEIAQSVAAAAQSAATASAAETGATAAAETATSAAGTATSAATTATDAATSASGSADTATAAAATATDKAAEAAQSAAEAAESETYAHQYAQSAGSAASAALDAKDAAESAAGAAATSKGYAEDYATVAHNAAVTATNAANAATVAAGTAGSSASTAQDAANTATQKASEASASAASATQSKQAAAASESDAEAAAQSAESDASAAAQSASNAAGSASTASAAASTAASKASEAAQSATTASGAADTATTKASEAAASAAAAAQSAASLTVDTELSSTSTNPVQNKVVDAAVTELKNDLTEAQNDIEAAQGEIETLRDTAYIVNTAEGNIAAFSDGAAADVKSLIVNIEPIQSGTGDPSPDNIRPISGRTGATVWRMGKNLWPQSLVQLGREFNQRTTSVNFATPIPPGNYMLSYVYNGTSTGGKGIQFFNGTTIVGNVNMNTGFVTVSSSADRAYFYMAQADYDNNLTVIFDNMQLEFGSTATDYVPYTGTTYPVSWETEAGTVYGGELDVVSGVLTVDSKMIDLGTLSWSYSASENPFFYATIGDIKRPSNWGVIPNWICSNYKTLSGNSVSGGVTGIGGNPGNSQARVCDLRYTDAVTFAEAVQGVQFVYELAEPVTYQLTPQQLQTLYGDNVVWSDAGSVSVDYRADTKLFIEQLTKPTEDDMTANSAIQSGKFFMIGNRLFISTAAIASGDTINPGTNCTELSLADALNNLN